MFGWENNKKGEEASRSEFNERSFEGVGGVGREREVA